MHSCALLRNSLPHEELATLETGTMTAARAPVLSERPAWSMAMIRSLLRRSLTRTVSKAFIYQRGCDFSARPSSPMADPVEAATASMAGLDVAEAHQQSDTAVASLHPPSASRTGFRLPVVRGPQARPPVTL